MCAGGARRCATCGKSAHANVPLYAAMGVTYNGGKRGNQSTKERTLHRFALYDIHLHQLAGGTIRTVVLYANGVQSAPDTLHIGSASYRVETIQPH